MVSQDMRWTRAAYGYAPPKVDTSKPSVARVYDAVPGGKDNFAVGGNRAFVRADVP
jgi:hypothetical protein